MSELSYQIFGSKSSKDYDVLLFVPELKTIEENHALIKHHNVLLEELFQEKGLPAKKVNCNLGICSDGKLVDVFKGTYDEVNNSLFYTYHHHTQFHPQMINVAYDRTNSDFFKHLKLKRCFRFLLSFYSRVPELREEIKEALRGDFKKRLQALLKIDFKKHTEFPKKKDNVEDIYKVIAFQLAQTLLLFENVEIYSKEEVLKYYPHLKPFILREQFNTYDLVVLNNLLVHLLIVGHQEIDKMKNLNEEIFGQ